MKISCCSVSGTRAFIVVKVGGKINTLAMRKKSSKKKPHSKYFALDRFELEWKYSPDAKGKGKAAGIDSIWPKEFKEKLGHNLYRLQQDVISGNFGYSKLRVFGIEKEDNKKRVICIPTVRDRLLQRLIIRILTKDAHPNKQYLQNRLGLKKNPIMYGLGLKPDTSVKDALNLAIIRRNKHPWVLKTDIQAFFDRIDRPYLVEKTEKHFGKRSFCPLIVKAINCEADSSDPRDAILLKDNDIVHGRGLRQGMPLSPLLSNFFLKDFDKKAFKKMGHNIIRYADDIIVFADSKEQCEEYLEFITKELDNIKQTIPSLQDANSKTVVIAPADPVNFLGIEIYKIKNGYGKRIRSKTYDRITKEFSEEASFAYATKNNITFSQLIQRLKDKIRSYKSTYNDTTNCDDLSKALENILVIAQEKIISDMFSREILDKLSYDQKKFLGLILT